MDEVTEYNQKAAALREEGRLEESVLVARKATTVNAEDPNAWWQLALSLKAKDGEMAAVSALEKVVELAPSFANGWCELGYVFHKNNQLPLAIEKYETALACDAEHVRSLKSLQFALGERNEEDDPKRRLEVLRVLQNLGELSDDEQFDLAYTLMRQREYMEAARVYEAYLREHDSVNALHNLALAYRNLGRDADALDAYRLSRIWREFHGMPHEPEPAWAGDLLKSLQALRQRVLTGSRACLPPQDWYKHYVNPFVLLNVKTTGELKDNPKALQKAKQAVLREIELEEGKVAWLPGLAIDKSTAMALFEQLSDEVQWVAHKSVFNNRRLCDFMSRGDLQYFLAEDEVPEEIELPHEHGARFLEIIGPPFAQQFSDVLVKAIERGDVDAVECLLDGRRQALPEHEEHCFEGARRALLRRCEALQSLALESEARTVTLTETELVLSRNRFRELLDHLPAEFHEVHLAVGRALRTLSVNHYNREYDAEAAKAILQLGKASALKSPALAHQLEEDEKLLTEKIAEERQHEAHLVLQKKALDITKLGVSFGDVSVAVADIVGIRWGKVQTSVSPVTLRYRISFKGAQGQEVDASWTVSKDLTEQDALWGKLVEASFNYLIPDIIGNFKRRLAEGLSEFVGPLEVQSEGVVLEAKGWFSAKRVLCRWASLNARLENGQVLLHDATNPKASASVPLESTYNAYVLYMLANRKDT